VATILAIVAAPRRAAADDKPTLSGSWTASSLTESWSVSDWGEACGPKPASHGAGGGSVQIREQGGELSIVGAGRAFSTAECWEQMPGLARTSHSQSGGGRFWRTRCTNPANDPRHAVVTTSISATDNSIVLSETGEYEFLIKDTKCRASASRSRSFSLVRRDGEAPPTPSASAGASAAPSAAPTASAAPASRPPEPRPASRCTGSAGDPARLEVHPGRKLIRAGDKFAFRAVVVDADGCPTGTRPSWSIAPGPLAGKANIDQAGTLTVAADSAEGRLEVSAAVAGKGVTVIVDVASPEHYDALLGASGLNAAGEADQAAIAVIATGTIGGRTAVAEDAAKERKILFVTIVGGVAAALGFIGLVLARRGSRREPAPDPAEDEARPDSAPVSADPVSMGSPAGGPPASAGPPAARGPAAAGPPRAAPKVAARGKICPTCGERYDSEATFCGKDATTLVLLN
jgi:hypothetical protein